MIEDPIVEEIHATRERLLREHSGYEGLREELRAIEQEWKDHLVRLTPRPPADRSRKIS